MANIVSDDAKGVGLARKQFESFIDATMEFRERAALRRDYYDGIQWTSEQAAILRDRKQAAIVVNRIAPKTDFLVGLEMQTRTDPKAYPRTPKHEQGAEAATDALRYLEEINELDHKFSEGFGDLIIEGIEAYLVSIEPKKRGPQPKVERIPWDRFYYDPHSRRNDFRDAGFLGLTTWMTKGQAKRLFPKHAEEIESWVQSGAYADADLLMDQTDILWWDNRNNRIRINQHYYIDDATDQWMVCYFAGNLTLIEAKPVPYVDEDGRPCCPIKAASVFVTRENERYGLVERLMGIQDEVNHRRSKALHMLSSVRVWGQKGVFDDVQQVVDELRKATGVVEANGVFGADWGVMPNGEYAQGQLALLQEAKNEIDAVGANAALAGKDDRALSGRALQQRAQSGTTEIGPVFDAHRRVKLSVYRALWMLVRQFWTEETWVRVTDDERNVRFVGLNRKVTHGEKMQKAGAALMNPDDPQNRLVVEIENNVEEMDVDIIIEDAPDTVTLQQEQFEVIAQLAGAQPQNPALFEAVIELSAMRSDKKRSVLEKLKGGDLPEAQQMLQARAQSEQAARDAKTKRDNAAAMKDIATAGQTIAETQQVAANPMLEQLQSAAPA